MVQSGRKAVKFDGTTAQYIIVYRRAGDALSWLAREKLKKKKKPTK